MLAHERVSLSVLFIFECNLCIFYTRSLAENLKFSTKRVMYYLFVSILEEREGRFDFY